jgi:hypothetical protein
MTDRITDTQLEALFAETRQEQAAPSDDLMSRILADAVSAQSPIVSAPPKTETFWSVFSAMIGGWPAASGLAAATVAGIWIGVAPPQGLSDVASTLTGGSFTVDILPDADILALEG